MKLYGVAGLAAAGLLAGCSGIVANHTSPDRIRLGDFQKADSGIVVLSMGSDKECSVYSKFMYVKDANGADVPGFSGMSIDVYAVKSDFTDHYGTVNALTLPAGKYFLAPRYANWQIVSKTMPMLPFEVVPGQTTYLGEVYLSPACGQESRMLVRDQYPRDMRVLIGKNPAFAQRQVVKHLLLDVKDIGGEQHAAELIDASAIPARWSGNLACSARADSGANAAAFDVKLAMDVTGNQAVIRRAGADLAESLTGAAVGLDLDMRGEGHRLSDPGRAWQYRLKGKFVQDGRAVTAYSATGSMLVNGAAVRSCQLRMTPM
ncbi:hypothetical protein GCM10027277_55430 [Pseudoduganella ginsengisoli]|uniref:DUF4382 domain-containing protein n=1 Tax=Pseudoduganella ginsengisoli TaxID=1462440 RepID=A0A6L6Q6D3_9BURK|nr:hypothetical protein [Pseudoduganella ginsengisoli]MTW04979.1 hypothetical protein [Pseudoduganella ginsengisoli]